MKKTLFLIFYLLCGSYAETDQDISFMYLQDNEIKLADEVFVMSYSEDGDVLKVNWSIEDGYYLYFDSILIKENQKIVDFDVTDGMIIDHEDEFFGETKIIRNVFGLSFIKETETNLTEIAYQGCSDRGFCYPIQNKNIR